MAVPCKTSPQSPTGVQTHRSSVVEGQRERFVGTC